MMLIGGKWNWRCWNYGVKKILKGKKAKEMKKSFEEFKKKVKTKFHFSEEKDYGNCY
jgi:hypothetical protein